MRFLSLGLALSSPNRFPPGSPDGNMRMSLTAITGAWPMIRVGSWTFEGLWSSIHHFLMRSLPRCFGEFNLMALCYNSRQVLQEIGVGALVACCRIRKEVQGIGMRFFPGKSVFSGQNRQSWR